MRKVYFHARIKTAVFFMPGMKIDFSHAGMSKVYFMPGMKTAFF